MKKSLVLVMALVLVVAFAFADEVGKASLGTDKGVITAGDPLNVSFTLSVEDVADDVTTIEVMGDEVADDVFVMLIKDLPNEDATYEAQKVVDPDAQKTTYYIKAQELVGTKGNIYAELRDWNGEKVAEATEEFAWKGTTWTDTLQLVPEVEGLYTVIAYIEFEDGTRMELKGWEGYAQLVALDNYMKETVPGLEAWVSNDGGYTAAEYGSYNELTVNAGVEFMYAKANPESQASDSTYLGVYGDGSQKSPELMWRYNKGTKPEFADVELRYAGDGDAHSDDNTAYIKFKVMGENFAEGDCCATPEDTKWALWMAIGTGEYHTFATPELTQGYGFHVLYGSMSQQFTWEIIKGAPCKGWIKAIFYLDPSDVHIWLYAILGTYAEYDVAGQSGTIQGDLPDSEAPGDQYDQNFLTNAELNLISDVMIKDVITLNMGVLDIPVTKDPETTIKGFLAGNIKLSDDAKTVDLGGSLFTTNIASMTGSATTSWQAYAQISGLEVALPGFGLLEEINNIRFGAIASGYISTMDTEVETGLSDVELFACFSPDGVCCLPGFKVGLGLNYDDSQFSFSRVFGEYTHDIGKFGPVALKGTFGAVFSNDTEVAIDANEDWGENAFKADSTYDWVLGVGYEVTGSMTW